MGPRADYNLSSAEGLATFKQDLAAAIPRVSTAESVVTAAYVLAPVVNLG